MENELKEKIAKLYEEMNTNQYSKEEPFRNWTSRDIENRIWPLVKEMGEILEGDKENKVEYTTTDSILKVNGRRWFCDCGCNVGRFSKDGISFKCNGCQTEFETE